MMIKDILNSHFNDLEFEPIEHKYMLEGQNMTPVSNVVETFYEPFSDQISVNYANRYNLNVDDVRTSWKNASDIACNFGHSVHNFGEQYYSNKNLQPSNNHELALVNFWNDLPSHIIPIACETKIYTRQYGYAGTFDLLLHDTYRGGTIIVDYKTNQDLFKNYKGKLMLSPFDFLLDTPYNHYQLQLSLYQIPLEELDIDVIDRWIVWLKGSGDYSKYETYNYTEYLKTNLK